MKISNFTPAQPQTFGRKTDTAVAETLVRAAEANISRAEDYLTEGLEQKLFRIFNNKYRPKKVRLAARNQIIEKCSRLIDSIAKRYVGRGLEFGDLHNEGVVGAIKATEKFKQKKGYRFSTYATWWIRQAMQRALTDKAHTVRVPVHIVEWKYKYKKAERILKKMSGVAPTAEEIREKLGVSEAKFALIQKALKKEPLSLEASTRKTKERILADIISDERAVNPPEGTASSELKAIMQKLLRKVDGQSASVLRLSYGLEDGIERSPTEIAQMLRLTPVEVNRIKSNALRNLKPHRRPVEDYLHNAKPAPRKRNRKKL